MSLLVAVDPSIRSSGVAIFVGGVLHDTWRSKHAYKGTVAERARFMALDICGYVRPVLRTWASDYPHVDIAFEWPQIYRASKSKGDPNDLPALAAIGMGVACLLDDSIGRLCTYTPREWAGAIPKTTTGDPWTSPRSGHIRARLSDSEIARVIPQHDVIDAVGIGLHALGRGITKRHRVLKGAT